MGVVRQLRQVSADNDGIDLAFRADVRAGLTQAQKAIPARWFYDATGSALFEDITALPEYYPTRSETDLLQRHAAAIAAAIGPGRAAVELGSVSSTKPPLLLERSEEHTSELQSLMRTSYAVFSLNKKKK